MTIQSVSRALNILGLFSLGHHRLGISEISEITGLHKATVQGLVRTLLEEGFLQQDPETRKYQLGLRVYELGMGMVGNLEINQRASAPTYELAKRVQLQVRISILDNSTVVVTLDAYPRLQPFLSRQFGPRLPLYCTSMGKVLLAYLDEQSIDEYLERAELIPYTTHTINQKDDLLRELGETRERGYALSREEHLLGRAAIAAPIFGRDGKVAAALSIVGEPSRILGKKMEDLANAVMLTAAEIGRTMGYFPRPITY